MTAPSDRGRMRWIAGALASISVLAPASALAIFPPVIQQPTVSVTGVKVQPIVTIQGGHVPPPVVVPPTATTPEPATIVTGLMSLALGGFLLRKKRLAQIA